jgi:hypothetical protein
MVAAIAATTSIATAVQYTFQGETGGVSIQLQTPNSSGTVALGQFHLTTSDAGWNSDLYTYCTDVGVTLATTHAYTPFSIPPSQLGVSPSWVSGGIEKAAALYYYNNSLATAGSQKAGLQLAIWEALYSTKSSYTKNDFFSSLNPTFHILAPDSGTVDTVATYAAQILNAVLGLSSADILTADQNTLWLAPVDRQGHISGSQGLLYPGNTTVPEADSTLTLLGVAITAIGVAGRRMRRS